MASQTFTDGNDAEEEAIIEYLAQNLSIEEIHEYITSEEDNN